MQASLRFWWCTTGNATSKVFSFLIIWTQRFLSSFIFAVKWSHFLVSQNLLCGDCTQCVHKEEERNCGASSPTWCGYNEQARQAAQPGGWMSILSLRRDFCPWEEIYIFSVWTFSLCLTANQFSIFLDVGFEQPNWFQLFKSSDIGFPTSFFYDLLHYCWSADYDRLSYIVLYKFIFLISVSLLLVIDISLILYR